MADTRTMVVLVAGIGGMIALSASNKARASAPPSTPTRPAGGGSPGPSSSTVIVLVADAQKTLNALGAKVGGDGLYGPKTKAAWGAAAKKQKLDPAFARVDGKHARVSQDTARKLSALAIARGAAGRASGDPEGNVLLGPITTIKTNAAGTTKSTDYKSMTPAERAQWAAASGDYGVSSTALLSDDQAYALEDAQIEGARASLPGADAAQQEKAKRAAARAAQLLGRKSVAPIPRAPSNPTVRAPEQERGDTDDDDDESTSPPGAYVSPPTPINLEAARKEAQGLAKHLRTKGRAGYSRQSVRAFQGHAGITVDGIYGPLTADALKYFGASAPAAFFHAAPGSVTTYTPN